MESVFALLIQAGGHHIQDTTYWQPGLSISSHQRLSTSTRITIIRQIITFTTADGSGPPFRKVRHSESRHSWSLHGIVLDMAKTRRLTPTLTLTVSLTVSCHCWKWLKMADPSEWRPLRMAGRHPADGTSLVGESFQRQRSFSLELAVIVECGSAELLSTFKRIQKPNCLTLPSKREHSA